MRLSEEQLDIEFQNEFLDSPRYNRNCYKIMSIYERVLVQGISSYNPCIVSYAHLSSLCPMSRRQCIRCVKSLEEKGIIHVKRTPRKKGQQQETNKITINIDKIKELLINEETCEELNIV